MIPVIDMHCDTISLIHRKRNENNNLQKPSLMDFDGQLNLPKMQQGGYMCQNFALFTYLGYWNSEKKHWGEYSHFEYATPYDYAMALSHTLDTEVAAYPDQIRKALTAEDIENNFRAGLLSAVKTVEEGAVFEGSVDRLKEFYDAGMRMTTLTWNYENELGFPNAKDPVTGNTVCDFEHGLKKAGKEIVEACGELGIILDLAHLNDGGIKDVFDIVQNRRPIVSSHSDCRAITGHPRNLADENLRRIAECGGVVGVNYCDSFLNDRKDNTATMEDMIRHIRHMKQIAGIESIGLGSDFDGIDNTVEFGGAEGMQRLAAALEQAGFTIDEIEKIFYKNVLRVYHDVLG